VAIVFHAHLLSPFHFAYDLSKAPHSMLLRRAIEFPLIRLQSLEDLSDDESSRLKWAEKYPYRPYQVFEVKGRLSGQGSTVYVSPNQAHAKLLSVPGQEPSLLTFGLDLVEAIKRQWEFTKKIIPIYPKDPIDPELLIDAQLRYAKFMYLLKDERKAMMVPTLDIDLFWHTHLLSSVRYNSWCHHHLKRSINHDDTLEEGDLSDGMGATKKAWLKAYNQPYFPGETSALPSSADTSSEKGQTFLDHTSKTPPTFLDSKIRALWIFDVQQEDKHQTYDRTLRQLEERVKLLKDRAKEVKVEQEKKYRAPVNNRSAKDKHVGPNGQETTTFTPGTAKTLLWRFLHPEGSWRSTEDHEANVVGGEITLLKKNYERDRTTWKRLRYPLLRAVIGTTDKKNFPLYSATWYNDVPLGYYDYGNGGNGGLMPPKLSTEGSKCGTPAQWRQTRSKDRIAPARRIGRGGSGGVSSCGGGGSCGGSGCGGCGAGG
jgi:Glycine-rich domain-containing protein-like